MLEIVKSIVTCIEQHRLFPAHNTIVVAVSGGADSLCLLHLLHQLCGPDRRYPNVQLHVAHLDHQLRPEVSARDAATIAHIAESWHLPVTLGVADVPAIAREEGRSLEEAARIARYRFLRTVAQSLPAPTRIAVAHQRDDQVETLLLHWLRGGGITSAVGLQPKQQDIIRPLLTVTHAETLAYCQQQQLTPRGDERNLGPRIVRNRIRHELLPLLESMNPGMRATLLRNAEVLQVDAAWIEAQIDAAWSTVVIAEQHKYISLQCTALLALPLSLQRHLLRRVTARLGEGQSPLELRHYKLIEQMLQQETGEPSLDLPGHLYAVCKADTLTFSLNNDGPMGRVARPLFNNNKEATLPIPARVAVPGTPWIAVAEVVTGALLEAAREALQREDWPAVWRLLVSDRYVVYVDAAAIGATLCVRTRRAGDRMRPLGMAHEKKIQDILVDRHIARAEREQIPLFYSAEHCVWLAGISLDDRVQLSGTTREIVRLAIIPDDSLTTIDSRATHTTRNPRPGIFTGEEHMHEDIAEILISTEQLNAKIAELGEQITRDYSGRNLLLLGTLKGAVPFIADLARAISLPLEIDYMAVASYGDSTHSSGIVRIIKDLEGPIDQKHVLIIEDIIDSGLTLSYLTDMLRRRNPLSLCICTLLDKERERLKTIGIDYVGFTIPDKFVVGYGLDYAQRYRNLPYIGILKPAVYEGQARPETHHQSPAEK